MPVAIGLAPHGGASEQMLLRRPSVRSLTRGAAWADYLEDFLCSEVHFQ